MSHLLEEVKEEAGRLKKEIGTKSRALVRLEDSHKEISISAKVCRINANFKR